MIRIALLSIACMVLYGFEVIQFTKNDMQECEKTYSHDTCFYTLNR